MRRMARRKFGRRWKNSVKSTFGISDYSHSPFYILTWSTLLGAALHAICIPRMMVFLLFIVDAKSFLDVTFTCKLRLVLYSTA